MEQKWCYLPEERTNLLKWRLSALVLSLFPDLLLFKNEFFILDIGKKVGITEADILVLPFDVTNFDSHENTFKKVIQHFGTVSTCT